jgi:hypothetical protein
MPRLHDLSRHPFPEVLTLELINSVTVSTVDNWITEKCLLPDQHLSKVKHTVKESALLLFMSTVDHDKKTTLAHSRWRFL